MGMKPLVFLHPLSERLNQLKESVEETAEAENIEIYEIESLEELSQVAPHLGQFLALCSNPKLCARMLQLNSRVIKKEESKVILLSAKQYPPKTIDRLNKLGLTDFILDSVAAKTLQYKVKLQMRSITVKKESEKEVLIKHEEDESLEEKENVQDSTSADEEESYYKSKVKKEKPRSEMNEEEINELQKKILDEEDKKENQYPGKTSLTLDKEIDPNEMISLGTEDAVEENDEKASGRRSESLASHWSSTTGKEEAKSPKETAAEKRKNLPWHKKAKENGPPPSGTENINNVWSSQNHKAKPIAPPKEELQGQASTDMLEKDHKGDVNDQEGSIDTHWEGEVLDSTREDKGYGVEESLYGDNIEKHYEGEVKKNKKINQDFGTAETDFKEKKKEKMLGAGQVDKKEGLLEGNALGDSISSQDLQTDSKGTDSFDGEIEGTKEKPLTGAAGNLLGSGKTKAINDELKATLDKDRNHKSNDEMNLNPDDRNLDEIDLKEETNTEKTDVAPMASDSRNDRLDNKLRAKLSSQKDKDVKRPGSSLMSKIENTRKNKKSESQDGYIRSPNAKKKNATIEKKNKNKDEVSPLLEKEALDDPFVPSDGITDNFENLTNDANTEIQMNDELTGENTLDQQAEDISGESSSDSYEDELAEDTDIDKIEDKNIDGKTKFNESKGDTWDNFGRKSTLDIEAVEEEKKKKRLEELYALKERKLKEIEDKKKKREATLAAEEDLYKKDRDWDEKAFNMDNEKSIKQEDNVDLAATSKSKSDQQNLKDEQHEKTNSFTEEVTSNRSRHKHEEIELDTSDLSNMERELINGHKDWGEQTIDYRKMKAGEEAFTTTRESAGDNSQFNISEREIQNNQEKVYNGIVIDGDIQENHEEQEGDTVFHPDSKGIESVIHILNSYLQKDIMPSDILKKVVTLMNKEVGYGVASFFYRPHSSKNFNEILNGHSIYSSEERLELWQKQKETEMSTWSAHNLPFWSDNKFKKKDLYFLYPFYEGIDHLGFAIVSFSNGMKKESCQRIEITLEAARSVYLSLRHKENGDEAIYNERKEIPLEKIEAPVEEVIQKPSGFMAGKDNLIMLEKRRAKAEKEKKIEKEKKESKSIKSLWKRMFG